MHRGREGVIPHDYFMLDDLDSLDQRPAKLPLGSLTLELLLENFSLFPSGDVERKNKAQLDSSSASHRYVFRHLSKQQNLNQP